MTGTSDEAKNILEVGALHRVMVLFQKAEELPASVVFLIQILGAGLVGLVWRLVGAPPEVAILGSMVIVLAGGADVVLLRWLPRERISFGPWKPQTVVLLIPRVVAGLASTTGALIAGWSAVLMGLSFVQGAGLLVLLWATAVEPRRLALTHLELEIDSLPPGAEPLRVLHISDIHLERFTEREKRLLDLARKARPDMIVITGDYLNLSYNRDEIALQQVAQLLAQLEAPHGVYATLGSPPVDLREVITPLLESLPLRLLRDEWTTVELKTGGSLVLMGVDCTHYIAQDAQRLEELAATAPNSAPRVLLYHSPEIMPQAIGQMVDLYLCGHTHGGQVRLPLVGPILTSSQLGRRYVMGHYCEGSTHLYVSRGVGMEGLSAPRVRLLAPPEITLVTLRSSDAQVC